MGALSFNEMEIDALGEIDVYKRQASSSYRGTVESSAGTAAKPAAVDTGPADRLTTAPVSYTHLDVYKRQIIQSV